VKKCAICLEILLEENFYKNNRKPNGLQSYCKPCSKKRRIEHFKKNIKSELETRRIYTNKQKDRYNNYKKTLSCNICKENRHYVLDFHHTSNDKEHSIANMVTRGFTWDKILKEIKKCEVLCANCHREIHFLNKI
jgi:hypothetical protein